MKCTLLAVGKVKEAYYRYACATYVQRLKKYISFDIIEIKDDPKKETAAILKQIEGKFVVVLSEEGKHFSSVAFAGFLQKQMQDIIFVLGGPYGLDAAVKKKAHLLLSLSSMTLPHELCRVVFLEQLYRAHTILKGEHYHH